MRSLQDAAIGSIRVLAAHAKDDTTRACSGYIGLMPSPSDPLHLFILIKDIRVVMSSDRP